MSTRPFKIHVPDHKIDRLRQKLALADFPDTLAGSDISWDRGTPKAEVKRLVEVWQTSYDWRKAEAHLNTFPQFITPIEVDGMGTYDVHYIYKPSTRPDAILLLFLHSWPGGFFEVTKVLEDLVLGLSEGPAFHVVAPSLIDFGFSSAGGTGFSIDHHAEVYDKLVQSLGYSEYCEFHNHSSIGQA